jgi:hypothetical protein
MKLLDARMKMTDDEETELRWICRACSDFLLKPSLSEPPPTPRQTRISGQSTACTLHNVLTSDSEIDVEESEESDSEKLRPPTRQPTLRKKKIVQSSSRASSSSSPPAASSTSSALTSEDVLAASSVGDSTAGERASEQPAERASRQPAKESTSRHHPAAGTAKQPAADTSQQSEATARTQTSSGGATANVEQVPAEDVTIHDATTERFVPASIDALLLEMTIPRKVSLAGRRVGERVCAQSAGRQTNAERCAPRTRVRSVERASVRSSSIGGRISPPPQTPSVRAARRPDRSAMRSGECSASRERYGGRAAGGRFGGSLGDGRYGRAADRFAGRANDRYGGRSSADGERLSGRSTGERLSGRSTGERLSGRSTGERLSGRSTGERFGSSGARATSERFSAGRASEQQHSSGGGGAYARSSSPRYKYQSARAAEQSMPARAVEWPVDRVYQSAQPQVPLPQPVMMIPQQVMMPQQPLVQQQQQRMPAQPPIQQAQQRIQAPPPIQQHQQPMQVSPPPPHPSMQQHQAMQPTVQPPSGWTVDGQPVWWPTRANPDPAPPPTAPAADRRPTDPRIQRANGKRPLR